MKYTVFEKHFSSPRTNRYTNALNGDRKKAQKLYFNNTRLSQGFHPLLMTVEIWTRNSIANALGKHFSDPDWIINQKSGFMIDPSLVYIDKKTKQRKRKDFILKEVHKAEHRIGNKSLISSGKIIAEQSFGFWVAFMDKEYFPLVGGATLHAFPYRPTNTNRVNIFNILSEIRDFRNRINHGEPICFSNNSIDTTKAKQVFEHLKNISFWINPALQPYLLRLENGFVSRQITTIDRLI